MSPTLCPSPQKKPKQTKLSLPKIKFKALSYPTLLFLVFSHFLQSSFSSRNWQCLLLWNCYLCSHHILISPTGMSDDPLQSPWGLLPLEDCSGQPSFELGKFILSSVIPLSLYTCRQCGLLLLPVFELFSNPIGSLAVSLAFVTRT